MKKLLKETEIRKMMKFANIGALTNGFVDRLDEAAETTPLEEDEALNEEEEELDEYMAMTSSDYGPDMPEFGGHGLTPAERQAQEKKAKKEKEEEEKRKAAFNSARFQGENKELEEAEEEKVVEEAISNDQWYQSELFESLKKRWTK